VWHGPGLALTLFGCLVGLKALHCFLFPETALRSLQKVSVATAWKFIPVGVVYLALSAWIAWWLWSPGR
jgi:hypothetical protein